MSCVVGCVSRRIFNRRVWLIWDSSVIALDIDKNSFTTSGQGWSRSESRPRQKHNWIALHPVPSNAHLHSETLQAPRWAVKPLPFMYLPKAGTSFHFKTRARAAQTALIFYCQEFVMVHKTTLNWLCNRVRVWTQEQMRSSNVRQTIKAKSVKRCIELNG